MLILEPWPFWQRSTPMLGCSSSCAGFVHCTVVLVSDLYIFFSLGMPSTISRYQTRCLSWNSSGITVVSLQIEEGRDLSPGPPYYLLLRSLTRHSLVH